MSLSDIGLGTAKTAPNEPTLIEQAPAEPAPNKLLSRSTANNSDPGNDVIVRAHQLSAIAHRGTIYSNVNLEVKRGGLVLVTGPEGSGKTAFLLSITGRLRPTSGELTALGFDLPSQAREVQLRTSAMGIHGLDDLDSEVSVSACVQERMAWLAPWHKWVSIPDDATIEATCRPVFGDVPVPRGREVIHDLSEAQHLLLCISLAMIGRPELIVIDEIDQLNDIAQRDLVWERLEALTQSGTTVVASATSKIEYLRRSWTVQPLHLRLQATP